MFNFTFHNPTRILFGKGRIADIAKEIPPSANVLITYGGGSIKQNGIYAEVIKALEGYQVHEFAGIEANPTYETLVKAVDLVRLENIDFLLAVGGGSVIDGTKFIAAAVPYQGDPWEFILKQGGGISSALPLGTVLTLPASGSEMNNGAVITHQAKQCKLPFMHPLVFPRFSVLDPTKSYSLPARQIANGVVDTFVHVMEQYLTYPVNARIQDRLAEGLLLTLIEDGPRALLEPDNYEVRANLMWCATLALNGLIGSGVPQDWSTHMVGHEITALYGLDHAQTLAVLLPAMLQIRQQAKRDKLLQYGLRVWGIVDEDEDTRIHKTIQRTSDFFIAMQLKTRLRDYNLSRDSLPLIVAALQKHGMTKLGERRDVSPEVVEKVLELCW